jgi:hypothetical protein
MEAHLNRGRPVNRRPAHCAEKARACREVAAPVRYFGRETECRRLRETVLSEGSSETTYL